MNKTYLKLQSLPKCQQACFPFRWARTENHLWKSPTGLNPSSIFSVWKLLAQSRKHFCIAFRLFLRAECIRCCWDKCLWSCYEFLPENWASFCPKWFQDITVSSKSKYWLDEYCLSSMNFTLHLHLLRYMHLAQSSPYQCRSFMNYTPSKRQLGPNVDLI